MTQKFVCLTSSHVALMQLDWGTHFEIQGQLPTLNTRISSGTNRPPQISPYLVPIGHKRESHWENSRSPKASGGSSELQFAWTRNSI